MKTIEDYYQQDVLIAEESGINCCPLCKLEDVVITYRPSKTKAEYHSWGIGCHCCGLAVWSHTKKDVIHKWNALQRKEQ